jgi:hypothetical protein
MIAPAVPTLPPSPLEDLHSRFQTVLPRIERHARIYFRAITCPDNKADCIAETLAVAWQWFVRLAERGKDATQFASALATLAARAVRSGRRVCGREKARDVLSPLAQRRHGFAVERLSDVRTRAGSPVAEALTNNTVTPPADQAAFRCDFPHWLGGYGERDRQMIDDLMVGERTADIAKKYGLSSGRVSQKRRAFHRDWCAFHGDLDADPAPGRACGA